MDLNRIKEHVEETLVYYGMNATEFSRATGVNGTLISQILNGKRKHISTMHLSKMLPWINKKAPKRELN